MSLPLAGEPLVAFESPGHLGLSSDTERKQQKKLQLVGVFATAVLLVMVIFGSITIANVREQRAYQRLCDSFEPLDCCYNVDLDTNRARTDVALPFWVNGVYGSDDSNGNNNNDVICVPHSNRYNDTVYDDYGQAMEGFFCLGRDGTSAYYTQGIWQEPYPGNRVVVVNQDRNYQRRRRPPGGVEGAIWEFWTDQSIDPLGPPPEDCEDPIRNQWYGICYEDDIEIRYTVNRDGSVQQTIVNRTSP